MWIWSSFTFWGLAIGGGLLIVAYLIGAWSDCKRIARESFARVKASKLKANPDEPVLVNYVLECLNEFGHGNGKAPRLKVIRAQVLLNGITTSMTLQCQGARTVKTSITDWGLIESVVLVSADGQRVKLEIGKEPLPAPVVKCIEFVKAHAERQHEEYLAWEREKARIAEHQTMTRKEKQKQLLDGMISQMNGAKQTSLSHAEKPQESAERGLSRMIDDSVDGKYCVSKRGE